MTVDGIFDVGLILQAAIGLPPGVTAQHITDVLRRLDDLVREIRDHTLAERGRSGEPDPAWSPLLRVLERSAQAKDQPELLRRHVAQTARAVQSAAADTAALRSGAPSLPASPGVSTTGPRSSGGGLLPIRPGK